ncbi:MAG: zinc ribbon domain-containing protein [Promethearchaeota archaeon]
MDYSEDGILEEFSFVLDGDEIFAMELRSYSKQEQFPLLGLIIAIVIISIIAVVVGVVVLVVVLVKKAKKKTKAVPPIPQKPPVDTKPERMIRTKEPTEEPEKIEFGFCEKCGSKRESDSAFCSYCGSKF